MTTIEYRYWIEADSFVHPSIPKKSETTGIAGPSYLYIHAPHALKNLLILVFHALQYFQMLGRSALNQTHYFWLNILTFL